MRCQGDSVSCIIFSVSCSCIFLTYTVFCTDISRIPDHLKPLLRWEEHNDHHMAVHEWGMLWDMYEWITAPSWAAVTPAGCHPRWAEEEERRQELEKRKIVSWF